MLPETGQRMDGHTSGQMTSSGRGRHLAGHNFAAAFSLPLSLSLASVGGFFAAIFYLRCGCGFVPDANTRARFVASSLRHLFCSILLKLRLYLLNKSNFRVVEFLAVLNFKFPLLQSAHSIPLAYPQDRAFLRHSHRSRVAVCLRKCLPLANIVR